MVEERSQLWDIVKGLGIICVFWGHNWTIPTQHPISNWVYSFHMPLFFLVCGVLQKDHLTWGIWLRKAWKGRILPFLVFSLLGWSVGYVTGNPRHSLGEFLGSVLRGHPTGNGPLWFLVALLGGGGLIRLFGMGYFAAVVLGVLALCFSLFYESVHGFPLMVSVWPLSACFILIGHHAKPFLIRICQLHEFALGVIFIATLTVTVLCSGSSPSSVMAHSSHVNPIFVLTAVIGFIMTLSLTKIILAFGGRLAAAMSYIGSNSMFFFACDFVFRSIEGKIVHKMVPSMSTWPCYSGWSSLAIVGFSIVHLLLVAVCVPLIAKIYRLLTDEIS